ncbi:MAG: PHP domain-containing protein, partial [Pseudomonadota bacterium]
MNMVANEQEVAATSAVAPVGPAFVHLRVHSEYSIVDGLVRIDDLVGAAAKDKQAALAVTDLANMFGMVKFYKAARGKGIKPVVGVDVWITNDDNREKPSRLMLFAKNRMGYLQLCELLSQAWLTNQYKGRAEIRTEWLAELTAKTYALLPDDSPANGLIVLSGAHFGDVGQAIENGNPALAEKNAEKWAKLFPGHFYIEIQRAGQANQETQVRHAVALAAKLGLPVVATH